MAEERHNFAELLLPAAVAVALLALWGGRMRRGETIESLEAKLRQAPANAAYHERLAGLLVPAGRREEAITHYRRALELNPASAGAPCGLARALAAQGGAANMLEAQRLLEKSLKLHPDDAATNEALADLVVQSLGELAYPTVQRYYEAALQAEPERPGAALMLARIYVAQGRAPEAGRILDTALRAKANDGDAALHLQRGAIWGLLGQYDRAAAEYNAGTARDPNNAEAFCAWGVMLIAAGRPESAETVLRRAVALAPANAVYHVHLARALRNAGRFSEAMEEFKTALDQDIKCIPAYLELAASFQSVHDEKTAENFLRQGMLVDPANLPIKAALATFLTHAADPARRNLWEAATLLQTCVEETHGQDVSVMVGAAEAWARVEQLDRALSLIEDALAGSALHGLTPEQQETLRWYRQGYLAAQMPPEERNMTPYLALDGRVERDPVDVPWPEPWQPRVETLMDKRMDLSKVPGPGSALDPALYMGDAVKPVEGMGLPGIGYRP